MEIEQQKSNTYVFDAESAVEMARLIDLDRVMTRSMGGPLSGVSKLPEEGKVLDLGCGPGGWVCDVAFARPDLEVAGVDVSKTMTDYANARAHTQQLPNASFGVMDITQPLDFSDNTFDLVNARFLSGTLRRATWPAFLAECTRILKPGGTLRLTEPIELGGTSTSEVYERSCRLFCQALWSAGYGFSVDGYTLGTTTVLPRMLRNAGYRNVHCLAYVLEFSSDCDAWQNMYRNIEAGSYLSQQFLTSMGLITPEEIQHLLQQTFIDMHSSDFCGMWHFVTILGEKA